MENVLEVLNDTGHNNYDNKCYILTQQNLSICDSKKNNDSYFSTDDSSICYPLDLHDTTAFFYRPQSSNVIQNVDDFIALYKRKYRTNLKNTELSKRTFRIFLEKQILSHVEVFQNISEAQTPITPNSSYDKSNFLLEHAQLTLTPLHTKISQTSLSTRNNLTLSNLKTVTCSDKNAVNVHDTTINCATNSEVGVYENVFQHKSDVSIYNRHGHNQNTHNIKSNTIINNDLSHTLIRDNSPEWFRNNETVSVHGSILSESISDMNIYNTNSRNNTNANHKKCHWRRILFCCVN